MAESKRSRSSYNAINSQELRPLVSNHQTEVVSDNDDYSPTIKLNDTSTWLTKVLKAIDKIGPQRLPEIEKSSNDSTISRDTDYYKEPNFSYGHEKHISVTSKKAIPEEKADINIIPKSTLVKLITGNSDSTLKELFTGKNSQKEEDRQRRLDRSRTW